MIKIGDRVRVTKGYIGRGLRGATGRVITYYPDDRLYEVKLDDKRRYYMLARPATGIGLFVRHEIQICGNDT